MKLSDNTVNTSMKSIFHRYTKTLKRLFRCFYYNIFRCVLFASLLLFRIPSLFIRFFVDCYFSRSISVIYHIYVWFMWFKRAIWRYLALFLCVFFLFLLSHFIHDVAWKSLKQTKINVTRVHQNICLFVSPRLDKYCPWW